MASVFKRKDAETGKPSGNWIIEYFDATGRRITKSSKTTDKAAAEQIARYLEAEVAKRKAGLIDPMQEAFALHAVRPLTEHLDAFEAATRNRASDRHIRDTRAMIDRVVEWCGWSILRDVEPDGVNRFANNLRAIDRSAATIGHYIGAIQSFATWAHESGRLQYDVLATLKKPNAKKDRKLIRRALSIDELQWLISTTETEPTRYGLSGRERALVYRVAVMTGLRAGELAKLTRGDFRLTDDCPQIVIPASKSKNGKVGYQPIASALVPRLLEHMATKSKEAAVFALRKYETADMVRDDMAAARAAWLATIHDPQQKIEADASDFLQAFDAAQKRIDFHALRGTGITGYAAIAEPKVTQEIARHRDIQTTFEHYVHTAGDAKQNAVERFNGLIDGPDVQRATGTIDPTPRQLQQKQQQSGRFSLRLAAVGCDDTREASNENEPIESQVFLGKADHCQGDIASSARGTRTPDQRIRNPFTPLDSTAQNEHPQQIQQHPIEKWCVLMVDTATLDSLPLSSDMTYRDAVRFAAGWMSHGSQHTVAVVVPSLPST